MAYTITETASVTMTVAGETVTIDLEPGDHDLAPEVADLLIAQGIATPATKTPKRKTSTED